MIKCPNCSHQNKPTAQICEVCGYLLVAPSVETRVYEDADYEEGTPKWGSARFKGAMNLVLDVVEAKRSFIFDYQDISEIIMGRSDASQSSETEKVNNAIIDLTSVGGLEKGVSRIHARIERRDGALHVVDNGSANGTYLNGQKLVAEQPRVIRDGDKIRLGHLVMRVTFRPVSAT